MCILCMYNYCLKNDDDSFKVCIFPIHTRLEIEMANIGDGVVVEEGGGIHKDNKMHVRSLHIFHVVFFFRYPLYNAGYPDNSRLP